jgi:hypothetical protein
MSRPKPIKIFITYSHSDSSFARKLHADLRASGLQLFFDGESIKGGDRIAEKISEGLAECDVYIPILSSQALKSPWCTDEINAALALSNNPDRKGRPKIISVLVEDCRSAMWPLLQGRLNFDFAGRYNEAFRELLERGLDLGTSGMAASSGSKATIEAMTKATIRNLRTEVGVVKESQRGMLIHVGFDINGFRAVDCLVVASFCWADGKPLRDVDDRYTGANGLVGAAANFSPGYDATSYDDFRVFMPYQQLHLGAGEHELKCKINVWSLEEAEPLAVSEWVSFLLTIKPVEIWGVWAEYNVDQENQKGMLVRVDFTIQGHKNEKCHLSALFNHMDDTKLKDIDGQYCTYDGQVAVIRDFVPEFEYAHYGNFGLFMPYDQIHAPVGDLKFNVAIHDVKLQPLVTSDWVNFRLETN